MDQWQATFNPAMGNDHNDMFKVIPPTPSQNNPWNFTQPQDMYHPQQHTLRAHRSTSSISSHFSSTSTSGGQAWSTMGTEYSDATGTETGSDEMDYSTPFVNGNGGPGSSPSQQNRLNALKAHGRVPSLVIDPKLFQPKERSSSFASSVVSNLGLGNDQDAEGEDDSMMTAKPKARGGRAGKKGGNNVTSPRKVSHARKQQADHIPRPRNAFILFRKHVVDSKLIPPSVEMRHQNVSIITAKMWAEASAEQKAHFNDLARIEKEEHMKKYPGYRYQPVYRRTNVIRRRVRKDEAEEEKCRSVAELLIKGKTGQDLESEIREKIQKAPTAPVKKTKSPGAKKPAGAAVALSKGAIRAIRAQARQSEWSDLSRSTSLAPSAAEDGPSEADAQLQNRLSSGHFPTDVDDRNSMIFDSPEPSYMDAAPPMFANNNQPMYQHTSDWLEKATTGGPVYSYPDHNFGQLSMQNYSYPQPGQPGSFYAFDQALPFSPSAGITSFTHEQLNFPANPHSQHPSGSGSGSEYQQQPFPDMAFPSFGETMSPTAMMYTSRPGSAKWDRNTHLPPSAEMSFEGLTFGESLLDDYGAALAQAEDMGAW